MTAAARIDFCGEVRVLQPDHAFVLGREGDLVIDDNPYLHRRFLQLGHLNGLWWVSNVGSALTATVADEAGLMQAWLAPGAQLPLVFQRTRIWFTAGPTTYELDVELDEPPFLSALQQPPSAAGTTVGRTSFTPDQRLLVLALAEPMLRHGDRGAGQIPTNTVAAERLGWTLTRFNRKLDNVCQKLAKHGVRGLHGDAQRLASQRRVRLVEYAIAARLVTREELTLLDGQAGESSPSTAELPRVMVPRHSDPRTQEAHRVQTT